MSKNVRYRWKDSRYRDQIDDWVLKAFLFREIKSRSPTKTRRRISILCRHRLQAARDRHEAAGFPSIVESGLANRSLEPNPDARDRDLIVHLVSLEVRYRDLTVHSLFLECRNRNLNGKEVRSQATNRDQVLQ
jgi:hypothetical protein